MLNGIAAYTTKSEHHWDAFTSIYCDDTWTLKWDSIIFEKPWISPECYDFDIEIGRDVFFYGMRAQFLHSLHENDGGREEKQQNIGWANNSNWDFIMLHYHEKQTLAINRTEFERARNVYTIGIRE